MLRTRSVFAVVSAAGLAVVLVALLPAPAAGQQIIASASSEVGNITRTEWTVQVGSSPIDRFQMVRIVKDRPAGRLRGSIFFLPPLGSSFSFYEQRDASGGVGTSIAGYFAERGYDVYGYVPRYVGIPAGTCEAGVVDCSVMGGWDLQSQLDDIAFIRQRIEVLHPGTKIVAGGASLGGILAVAAANDAPDDYDGVIVWEGMLASDDPGVQALNTGYCAALEAQLTAGLVFDGVGTNVFKQVTKAAELEPGGLTVNPLFPPALTNHQLLVLLLSVPSPGPVTMPVPGYILMNGSFADDRLFFASEPRLFENVGHFNDYSPNALVRDISCSLAGIETAYVANLGSFDGSVLAIGGGRGFGAFMGHQLSLFGTDDVTFLLEPDFAHIDHFMTERHREFVERPIFRWAERVFGRGGG
jgi:pimeloyl-ACP methyl ester carboxylesterase